MLLRRNPARIALAAMVGWQLANLPACVVLDPEATLCAIGEVDCSCTLGGSCDPGLSCVEDRCVDPNAPDTSGSASTGSGSSSSTTSTNPTDATVDPSETSTDDTSPPPGGANYMFVTSTRHTAALGGLDGADAICQMRADAAGLDGVYKAWLSTTDVSALERIGDARGWIRPDGRPAAADVAQLQNGNFFYPPVLDENGSFAAPDFVWTGTYLGMFDNLQGNTDCGGWTVADAQTSTAGELGYVGSWWSTLYLLACSNEGRLVCLGTDRQFDLVVEPVPGRRVFISQGYVQANQGRAAADTLCQQEAATAGFDGSYLALMGVDGEAPTDRFDLSGEPWVRVDGIPVFAEDGPLGDTLQAPFMYDSTGAMLFLAMTWAGSSFADVPGSPETTCSNWTATTGKAAMFGTLAINWQAWGLAAEESECAQGGYPVVCLQE